MVLLLLLLLLLHTIIPLHVDDLASVPLLHDLDAIGSHLALQPVWEALEEGCDVAKAWDDDLIAVAGEDCLRNGLGDGGNFEGWHEKFGVVGVALRIELVLK